MSQLIWGMVANLNTILTPLRETETTATELAIDWVDLRSRVRAQLEILRTTLSEHYSERDAYQVLFPLAAHCDELVKKWALDTQQPEWPPLQQELYQVDDAGDLFFELLENALGKPETLSLVYDIYYFCLNDGFYGRYSDNPERLNDYRLKLRNQIRLPAIAEPNLPAPMPTKLAYFRIPDSLYYWGAGGLLILLYSLLTNLANNWTGY